MANANVNIGVSGAQLQNYLNSVTNLFGKFGQEISSVAGGLGGLASASKLVQSSLRSFEQFNTQITRTAALAGATKREVKTLADSAMALGRATEHTAASVAQGMSNLALAGFRTEEIVAAMPGLLASATSGMVSLQQASNISAQVLRSFNLDATHMNYVAGTLTATFTSTNTVLSDLGETIKYVGADAHELGVTLSQVSAAAGVLGNVGVRGSVAGTGLREFIARLGAGLANTKDKTTNAAAAFASLGIAWKDVSDEAGNLNLVKSVGAMENAFDRLGLKAEERIKLLRPIFGVRAGTQVTALISQGAEILAAKELEVAFGGAKQQLDGLIERAQRLPEGVHGIKISTQEVAENFVTIGRQGAANLSRLESQMRELGLTGGFLNAQIGLTKDLIERVNGKNIKSQVFVPMEELGASTLRSVDAIIRLRDKLASVSDQAEKMAIIEDVFGADPRIMQQAVRAFDQGGAAMGEFANQMLRATSALDVQKKQLNTLQGSYELMRSAIEGIRIELGAVIAPIARIIAMSVAGAAGMISASQTLMSRVADFQENLGGFTAQIDDLTAAWNNLSGAGQVLAGTLLFLAVALPIGGFAALASSTTVVGAFIGMLTVLPGAITAGIAGIVGGMAVFGRYNERLRETSGVLSTVGAGMLTFGSEIRQGLSLASGFTGYLTNMAQSAGSASAPINAITQSLKSYAVGATNAMDVGVYTYLDDFLILMGKLPGKAKAMGNLGRGFQALPRLLGRIGTIIKYVFNPNNTLGFFARVSKAAGTMGKAFEVAGSAATFIWWQIAEVLLYVAMDLLPMIIKGFQGVVDAVSGFGTMQLPSVSAGEMQEAGPQGGMLVSVVSNLEYVINGLVDTIGLLVHIVIRLADAVVMATGMILAFIGAIIAEIIGNLPTLVLQIVTSVYSIIKNILYAVRDIIFTVVFTIVRWIAVTLYHLYSIVKALVFSIVKMFIDYVRILAVKLPLMFINMMLHIIASMTNVLAQIATIMIQIGATIIANTINWTGYLFMTILKITAILAALPITLPYLVFKAFQMMFSVAGKELESGSSAIISVLKGLVSRLWEIAKDFVSSLKTGIIRQIKDVIYTVINVIGSIFAIPFIVAKVVAGIYNEISSAMAHIWYSIVGWLDALPYKIAGLIRNVWAFVLSILMQIIGIFANISLFVGRLIIIAVSTVYKIIAGLVTELPYLILRIIVYGTRAFIVGMIETMHMVIVRVRNTVYSIMSTFHIFFSVQIRRTFQILQDAIPNLVEGFQKTVKDGMEQFKKMVHSIIYEMPAWIAKSLSDFVTWLQTTVLTLPEKVVTAALIAINQVVERILVTILNVADELTNLAGAKGDSANKTIIARALQYITRFPGIMIDAIAKAWSRFVSGLSNVWKQLQNFPWGSVAKSIAQSLLQIGKNIIAEINRVIGLVIAIAKGGGSGFVTSMKKWFGGSLFSGMKSDSIGNQFNAIIKKITTSAAPYWDELVSRFKALWERISSINWWDVIIGISDQLYDGIQTMIDNMRGWIGDAFGGASIKDKILEAFGFGAGPITKTIRNFLNNALDIVQAGLNLGRMMLRRIRERWSELMGALLGGLQGGVSYGLKFIIGSFMALGGILVIIGKTIWTVISSIVGLTGMFADLSTAIDGGDYGAIVDEVINLFTALANMNYLRIADIMGSLILRAMEAALVLVAGAIYGTFEALAQVFDEQIPLLGIAFRILGGIIIAIVGPLYLCARILIFFANAIYSLRYIIVPVLAIMYPWVIAIAAALWALYEVMIHLPEILGFITSIISSSITFVLFFIWDIPSAIAGVAGEIFDLLWSAGASVLGFLGGILDKMWSMFLSFIPSAGDLESALGSIWELFFPSADDTSTFSERFSSLASGVIGSLLSNLTSYAGDSFNSLLQTISSGLDQVLSVFSWDSISSAGDGVFSSITGLISNVPSLVANALKAAFSSFYDVIFAIGEFFRNIASSVVTGIGNALIGLIDFGATVLVVGGELVRGFIFGLARMAINAFFGLIRLIVQVPQLVFGIIRSVIANILGILSLIPTAVLGIIRWIINTVLTLLLAIPTFIIGLIKTVLGFLGTILGISPAIMEGIMAALDFILLIPTVIINVVRGIVNTIIDILLFVPRLISGIVLGAIDLVMAVLFGIPLSIIDLANNGLVAVLNLVEGSINLVSSTIINGVASTLTGIIEFFMSGINSLIEIMGWAEAIVIGTIEFILFGAIDMLQWITEGIFSIVGSLGSWLLEKISGLASSVWQAIVDNVPFMGSVNKAIKKISSVFTSTTDSAGKQVVEASVAMAEGGIVNKPTAALIGEDGPEAVMPLGKMKSMFGGFYEPMTKQLGALNYMAGTLKDIGYYGLEALQAMAKGAGSVAGGAAGGLAGGVASGLAGGAIGGFLASTGTTLVGTITSGLGLAFGGIRSGLGLVFGGIKSGFGALWNGVASGGTKALNVIRNGLSTAGGFVKNLIANPGQTLRHAGRDAYKAVRGVARGAGRYIANSRIGQGLSSLGRKAMGYGRAAVNTIRGIPVRKMASRAFRAGKKMLRGAYRGITRSRIGQTAGRLVRGGGRMLANAASTLGYSGAAQGTGTLAGAGTALGGAAFAGLIGVGTGVFLKVAGKAMGEDLGGITEVFKSAKTAIGGVVSGIASGKFSEKMTETAQKISEIYTGKGGLAGQATRTVEGLSGRNMINAFDQKSAGASMDEKKAMLLEALAKAEVETRVSASKLKDLDTSQFSFFGRFTQDYKDIVEREKLAADDLGNAERKKATIVKMLDNLDKNAVQALEKRETRESGAPAVSSNQVNSSTVNISMQTNNATDQQMANHIQSVQGGSNSIHSGVAPHTRAGARTPSRANSLVGIERKPIKTATPSG